MSKVKELLASWEAKAAAAKARGDYAASSTYAGFAGPLADALAEDAAEAPTIPPVDSSGGGALSEPTPPP